MPDIQLVVRAAVLGDRTAFGKLVERHQAGLRAFLLRLTGDEARADDIAQEAFIDAWLNIASFRMAAGFSTWLYRIAYRKFCDEQRSRHATYDLERARSAIDDSPPRAEASMDFERLLAILSDEERAVMALRFSQDRSIEEISRITGFPTGTVKSHIHRAKERLKEEINAEKYGR